MQKPKLWECSALEAIKHLGELCTNSLPIEILVAILPLLLQPSELSAGFLRKVLNSSLANHMELIGAFREATSSVGEDKEAMTAAIFDVSQSKSGLPSVTDILEYIKSVSDEDLTLKKGFYTMLLLAYSTDELDLDESHDILSVVERYQKQFKLGSTDNASNWFTVVAKGHTVDINIVCIKNIIKTLAWNINIKREN